MAKEEQLEKALAYFQSGKSPRECEKLTGVSKSTIDREAKKRGIEKGSLGQLITDMARVSAEFGTLDGTLKEVVSNAVDERNRHIEFFTHAAIKNVREAMKSPCVDQTDFKARADTIIKGKEAVLGKTPDTAIQINNTNEQKNAQVTPETADEARQIYEQLTYRHTK